MTPKVNGIVDTKQEPETLSDISRADSKHVCLGDIF